jgi:hypothetical protein
MSDTHGTGARVFFHGDGCAGENPQAFIHDITCDFHRWATIRDSEKFEWLLSETYPGSDADEFLNGLADAIKKVWTSVLKEFEGHWPAEKDKEDP